jgi:hypothetical protein
VQLPARLICRMLALGNPSVPAESKPLQNLAHARSASFQFASKSVSEMLERIPSLRLVASDHVEQPLER